MTSRLVVAERYLPDVMVNPQRYGFYVPAAVRRALTYLIPRPDVCVLLVSDPRRTVDRKRELSEDEVRAEIHCYRSELKYWFPYVEVRTDGPLRDSVEAVTAMLGRLAGHPGGGARPPYRVFPRLGAPRIIADGALTGREALEVYRPSARLARWAKVLAATGGKAASGIFFKAVRLRGQYEPELADIRAIVDSRWPGARLVTYLGREGCRQSLVVEIRARGCAVAYAKAPWGSAAHDLLSREARMLEQLAAVHNLRDRVPGIILRTESGAGQMIFLSGGGDGHRPHPMELGA
ncbi:MAG: hypothetical protein GWN84_23690, partial [Gammaproteobacteria bacterium]|nr:hypothetical protein [Gammaproteobacteria bacterium]NIR85588.1 hypothetical protein [Gammaproteobacteria bacterium]NIU05517.1 hypothetical protein [Gammaproteobacteria bacterium]NIX86790.1 hypothetical protein [Gammaproteobacteria bacterium]